MRPAALSVLLAGLLLAPAACSRLAERGSDPVEDAADLENADASGPESEADADPDPDPDAENADAGEAGAEAQDGGPSAEEVVAATQTAAARPTLSAEQVDLITNFRPPSKGSEDALITVYEFSDYL